MDRLNKMNPDMPAISSAPQIHEVANAHQTFLVG